MCLTTDRVDLIKYKILVFEFFCKSVLHYPRIAIHEFVGKFLAEKQVCSICFRYLVVHHSWVACSRISQTAATAIYCKSAGL